jgi:hypothetical protein
LGQIAHAGPWPTEGPRVVQVPPHRHCDRRPVLVLVTRFNASVTLDSLLPTQLCYLIWFSSQDEELCITSVVSESEETVLNAGKTSWGWIEAALRSCGRKSRAFSLSSPTSLEQAINSSLRDFGFAGKSWGKINLIFLAKKYYTPLNFKYLGYGL